MSDITKIKVDGGPESSYQLYPRNEEFAKRAGGNGGSQSVVQPDWNQSDETAPDYVKNRPFYTGTSVETVFVEESTASFTNVHGTIYMGRIQSNFEATVGETYKVSWDGVAYERTCTKLGESLYIGNFSIAGAGSDTGEPFLILVYNGAGIEIYTLDTSASHAISISGFATEVVKIDEKYLPEYSVLYSGNPSNWTLVKKKRMYDDFISGKLVLYEYSDASIGVVLYVFYSETVGLKFVFFTDNILRKFAGTTFSNPLDLSDYGINSRIEDKINSFTSWSLYKPSGSEVAGDLLSMRVAFDSTTKKACIFTDTKTDIGTKVENSTIVTNGDSDIVLSSSTSGSTKKFKITVDDSGALTATEVT